LSLCCSRDRRVLPSFPTRRSSDLAVVGAKVRAQAWCAVAIPANLEPGVHLVGSKQNSPEADRRFPGLRIGEIKQGVAQRLVAAPDRKSTRLNSSHVKISYAVFCLK